MARGKFQGVMVTVPIKGEGEENDNMDDIDQELKLIKLFKNAVAEIYCMGIPNYAISQNQCNV